MLNLGAFILFQEFSGDSSAAAGAIGLGFGIVMLAFIVFMIAAMWKVFEKAGEPGWAAIVPIYNLVVMMRIAGKPTWWVVLFFIPFVNFIIMILTMLAFATAYGKSAAFGLGLAFLPFIFFPVLAWGDARHSPQPLAA